MGPGINLVILPIACLLVCVDQSLWFGFEFRSWSSLGFEAHGRKGLVSATAEVGEFAGN